MTERIARLISNILNPFLISAVVLVMFSFKDTPSTAEAVKWILISLVIGVLPVLTAVIWLVKNKKMDGFFDNTRWQRRSVYLLASALGAIGCGVMWYFKAPEVLAVTFTAGFIEIVVFMIINCYWKISLHTAFTAAAVTVVCLVYGVVALWILIFLPLVGWARYRLHQHSLLQVAAGGLLAAAIAIGIYGGFGLIVV